jgi:hypothetical protein
MATSPSNLASTNVYSFFGAFGVLFISISMYFIYGKFINYSEIYSFILVFFVITFIIQFSLNSYLTSRKEMCGKPDFYLSFTSTLFPWIFVYGIIIFFIILMPGWLRVFSNTIGLYFAKSLGLNDVIIQLFTSANRESIQVPAIKNGDINMLKTIDSVYNDPTLLINELDPATANIINISKENYTNKYATQTDNNKKYSVEPSDDKIDIIIWSSFDKLLQTNLLTHPYQETIFKLYNLVMLKEIIGYSCWIFLGGILSVLISTNILLESGCKKGVIGSDYNTIFK